MFAQKQFFAFHNKKVLEIRKMLDDFLLEWTRRAALHSVGLQVSFAELDVFYEPCVIHNLLLITVSFFAV